MADTYTWTAGSGDYAVAGDWADLSSGLSLSPAAPGGTDAARIAAAGTVTGIDAAAALALAGSSAGAFTVAARLGAGALSLDGTVLVQGGTLTAAGTTTLGMTTAATVSGGGTSLVLPDSTHLTLAGVSGLTRSSVAT